MSDSWDQREKKEDLIGYEYSLNLSTGERFSVITFMVSNIIRKEIIAQEKREKAQNIFNALLLDEIHHFYLKQKILSKLFVYE